MKTDIVTKRILSLIVILTSAVGVLRAQDDVEQLMISAGYNSTIPIPSGTTITQTNWSRVGVRMTEGTLASNYKGMGIILSTPLTFDKKYSLAYHYTGEKKEGSTTEDRVRSGNPIAQGGTDYYLAFENKDENTIDFISLYFRGNSDTSASATIEKFYLVKNDDSKEYFETFTGITSYGVLSHIYHGNVIITGGSGDIKLYNEAMENLTHRTTDGETTVYTITLGQDIETGKSMSFRLFDDAGSSWKDNVKQYYFYPSTETSSSRTKLTNNGDGTYSVSIEVKPNEIGLDRLSAKILLGAGTPENPFVVDVRSVTRTGRSAVTIKNIADNIGWTTYCNSKRMEYSRITDLEAYIVTNRNAETGALTLQKINIAPENTPVILKVPNMEGLTDFTYGIPSTTLDADDCTGNWLISAPEGGFSVTADGNTYYALANKKHGIGFYRVQAGVTIPAGKAYLKVAGSTTPAPDYFGFEEGSDEPTAIESIKEQPAMGGDIIYDLQGRRVKQPLKGSLYIKNGKKYLAQ